MSTADLARQEAGPAAGEASLDLTTPAPDEITAETSDAIGRADALIAAAVAAAGEAERRGKAATFEALFGALDDAAREVGIAYGRYASQMLVASDDAVRDAAFAANEQIEAWRNAVPMRDDLVGAVGAFERLGGMAGLSDVERRYAERWQRDIRLAGGGLPAADREEIGRISARLVELVSAFQANLAKAPHIRATSDELEGAPDSVRSAATPIEGEPDAFDVPVNPGTYLGFVERTPNRALRERAYRAWCTQGVPQNLPLMRETFELRRRMARLLGYPSWQAYRADNLAAQDAAFINGFVADLATHLGPIRDREVAEMTEVLRARPGFPEDFVLQDWDWRYANTIQRDALGADAERLSEYFEMDRVLAGLATLSAEVFGVRLEPRPERTGWDPGVTAYDLVDVASGRTMAHVFLDPWARTGKQGGAWADWLLPGGGRHGEQRPPTISLVLNQARSADGSA
ncbi:MAG TPA: M3 family metallopeptidase, partial [Candidatus Limnocylindrales bacterium]|nr:M3 family metallopeptidase [Candidatus Limnocylindrales bacterium]